MSLWLRVNAAGERALQAACPRTAAETLCDVSGCLATPRLRHSGEDICLLGRYSPRTLRRVGITEAEGTFVPSHRPGRVTVIWAWVLIFGSRHGRQDTRAKRTVRESLGTGPRRSAQLLEEAGVVIRKAALNAYSLQRGDALIVVDVQNDFLPGGALAVPEGDAVLAPLNRCIQEFGRQCLPVFATRDWHPPEHCSFREQGGPWPPHCVAGTKGAEFPSRLQLPRDVRVISKATLVEPDAYSGFQGTDLAQQLADIGCRRVFIGGLATDYCVHATVLDARRAGFAAVVLTDAVRPVNARPGDSERALAEMKASGAETARAEHIAKK